MYKQNSKQHNIVSMQVELWLTHVSHEIILVRRRLIMTFNQRLVNLKMYNLGRQLRTIPLNTTDYHSRV